MNSFLVGVLHFAEFREKRAAKNAIKYLKMYYYQCLDK